MVLREGFRKIAASFVALVVAALTLLTSAPARAQVTGATLSGTVRDVSGGIIGGAQVSIKNIATDVTIVNTSNSEGFYTSPNLIPGTYEVSASAMGFATEVQEGVTLTVGADQVLDFSLKVGEVTQKVQVSGAAPIVQLASSTMSAVVDPETVVGLPLNGRDWTQLAELQPGVSGLETQSTSTLGASRGNRGYGSQLSISGTRPQLNNYRLDGLSIVDYAGGSPGSVLNLSLGVEAVAEFSVLTSNYDAEYGRTSGGVINAVTKNGTNEFHGDAFWFLRDAGLDASNFFDTFGNVPKPPFHRNQFGASGGGPIQKSKTFFFADYEGIRQALFAENVDDVPSPDARNGILHNADGTTTTVAVDPVVARYLNFWPMVNNGLLGLGNTGLFVGPGDNVATENFVTARIDHNFSEKDSVSGTWFYDKGLIDAPDPLEDVILGNASKRLGVNLEETHIFTPSLLNSVHGGFSRVATLTGEYLSAINPLINDKTLPGAFPGEPAPQVNVASLAGFAGGLLGPGGANNIVWNSFQLYDDAVLTKGAHALKFGFAFERMQTNELIPSVPNGFFSFNSLQDFLTNQPATFRGESTASLTPRNIRQNLFAGYFQDDWRLSSNLTLNLGLRYEMVTVPTEVFDKLVTLPTFTSAPPGHLGSPLFNNPTKLNFEPRVGFAWDPLHTGKTSIRGAFGIFDALPLNYEFFLAEAQSAPFQEVITAQNLPQGQFPTAPPLGSGSANLQTNSIQQNPSRNYVMIWNLNIQRELTPSTTLTVGYVGNRGVHMLNRADDVNLVLPTLTPEGYLWPFPASSGTRINPLAGDIRGEYWTGDAWYDALQANVTKKMGHGFQIEGSYTWGKSIDTGSASVIGDPFTNSISSPFWFCKSCRKGLSDFDIGQTFVANYLWDIPTPKNWGSVPSHVLGGWELSGIITAETGVPMTPTIAGDPLGLNSNDPFAYPDRLTGPGCRSLTNPGDVNEYIKLNCFALPMASSSIAAECTPFGAAVGTPIAGTCSNLLGTVRRNSVIGPGLADVDSSLIKNTRISENLNLQFRAEFFNIFNRANFLTPTKTGALFDQNGEPIGGAGSLTQTSTTAREIQFGLKLIW